MTAIQTKITSLGLLASSLLFSTALSSCGAEGPGDVLASSADAVGRVERPRAVVPAAARKLVPSDAFLYLQLRSLDALERDAFELGLAFGQPHISAPLVGMIEQMSGVDRSLIDADRPLGFALAFPLEGMDEGADAEPVFILPTADAEAVYRELNFSPDALASDASGDYIVIRGYPYSRDEEQGSGPPTGEPSARLFDLPEADIAMAVDLAALISSYRGDIEEGMEEFGAAMDEVNAMAMPGTPDTGPMMDGMLDGFRELIDSAESFSLALDLEGSELELYTSASFLESGPLSSWSAGGGGDPARLAAHLDQDGMMLMLGSLDLGTLNAGMMPMLEGMMEMAYAGEDNAPMEDYFEALQGLYDSFGSEFAMNFGFGSSGMQMQALMTSSDADAALEQFGEFYEADMSASLGVEVEGPRVQELEGLEFRCYTIQIADSPMFSSAAGGLGDAEMKAMMEAIYGEGGTQVALAAHEDMLIMVMGGDEALQRVAASLADGPQELSADLRRSLAGIGGGQVPGLVYHMDLRAMLQDGLELFAAMPGMQEAMPDPSMFAGSPIPIQVYGGVDGAECFGSLRLDYKALAEMVGALSGLAELGMEPAFQAPPQQEWVLEEED